MDPMDKVTGQRITQLRQSRGLTRERLAEMSDISVQFLADIEKGRKTMTVTTLRRVCKALSVTTDYLVNATEPINDLNQVHDMLSTLPECKQYYAKKLLEIYVQAVDD